MKLKKYTFIFAVLIIAMLALSGCSNKETIQNKHTNSKIKIITTIFPQYDWTRQIIGENSDSIDVELLMSNGTDLHNYQPTTEDIINISECDMFIYVGGESDAWVEDLLNETGNKEMIVVNLLDVLGDHVKTEVIKEGMQYDGHNEDGQENHDEQNTQNTQNAQNEQDEHVWLSLQNAKALCQYIADKICELDKDNESVYRVNLDRYLDKMSELNASYSEVVNAASNKTIVFADRFPFRYMVDDYKVDYYAAFSGCSVETEASFETIIFLSNKINELKLNNVVVLEGSDQTIAKTVIKNTDSKNQNIYTMDSMQSITGSDIESGVTYISIMEKNLEVLEKVLK